MWNLTLPNPTLSPSYLHEADDDNDVHGVDEHGPLSECAAMQRKHGDKPA